MRNINKEHRERLSTSEKLGLWVTKKIGTMICAYIFAVIGIISLVGAITSNAFLAMTFGAVSSYFLQLVLLPIIMVGQNVQSRHAEHVADATFKEVDDIHRKLDNLLK
jgi:uncharacterized membrane protein